jgi:DNA-binding SARP family transcriptional activator
VAPIKLHLLGPVSVCGSGGKEFLAILARPKRFALFAYLALRTQEGFCSRDSLLALFWPEFDQAHARGALRQAIHVLRSTLGGATVLAVGDNGVRLSGNGLWCDAVAFNAAVAAADFEQALGLYRGDLLEGFFLPDAPSFEAWLEDERVQLRARAAKAAVAVTSMAEASGQLTLAAYWARRALSLAPYSEEVLRQFIRILDCAGDSVQAVRTYDEFARRVERECNVTPSPQTRALVRTVRAR